MNNTLKDMSPSCCHRNHTSVGDQSPSHRFYLENLASVFYENPLLFNIHNTKNVKTILLF